MNGKRLTLQQCHICGKVISGTANLIRHIKSCKKKMCESCDNEETCKYKFWSLNCPLKNENNILGY